MKTLSPLTRKRSSSTSSEHLPDLQSEHRSQAWQTGHFPMKSVTTQGSFSSSLSFKNSFRLTLLLCTHVYPMWGLPCAHMWRSEDPVWSQFSSPPRCGFQGWNSALLMQQALCPLGHLAGPRGICSCPFSEALTLEVLTSAIKQGKTQRHPD